jgi:viroplasmin and RNaseH domain-containing protein
VKTEAAYSGCVDLRCHPYYVVFDGHELGVYYHWPNYHRQVHRFFGACYKKYNSYEEGIAAFKSRTNSNPALVHDDDFYLQNTTAAPPSSSFKIVVIVVFLIFVYLLWKKL